MRKTRVLSVFFALAALLYGNGAFAQSSSFTPGTVWTFSNIQIEPGQFENYMDFLATTWKKSYEFGKKDGNVVSYHVFQVNNPRKGDPDLILAIETKDYLANAEQLALQKKFEAFMATDARKSDTASGERKTMRKVAGSMELQELKLK